MAEVIKTGDVGLLTGKVAVLGYGSQGHAHALNLADSGVEVVVGLRPGSSSRAAAEEAGPDGDATSPTRCGTRRSSRSSCPDGSQAALYRDEVAPNLPAGRGAALRPRLRDPLRPHRAGPTAHDVIMVRAEGPRPHRAPHLRGGLRHAGADRRRPGRDRQRARARARLRRRRSAPARAGIIETNFKDETETDLFGEQSVLCGGLTQLIQLGFETLVEAGYAPELAYYECLHEVKLIVDLIYEGGIERMHYSISDTAEYGSHAVGPRVVDEHVRENMRKVLTATSRTARSRASGSPRWTTARRASSRRRKKLAETEIEQVGKTLRALCRAARSRRRMASVDVPVALLGYGTVGAAVNRLLNEQADDIERATGHRLRVVKALVRNAGQAARASRPTTAC